MTSRGWGPLEQLIQARGTTHPSGSASPQPTPWPDPLNAVMHSLVQNTSWLIGVLVVPMGLYLAVKALFSWMRFDAGTYSSQAPTPERPDLNEDWGEKPGSIRQRSGGWPTTMHANFSGYRPCAISAHR